MKFDEQFWSERYKNGMTGWDAGSVTTPIKEYFDQVENKDLKILIPGSGYGHEAEYLYSIGFKNIFVLDISEEPFISLKKRLPKLSTEHFIVEDFFDHKEQYDIILEQTFLSALSPSMRPEYAQKMHDLLVSGGRLVGVLFGVPLNTDHPPFGGSLEEYNQLFNEIFKIKVLDVCYNSIPPRQGSEVFINLLKS